MNRGLRGLSSRRRRKSEALLLLPLPLPLQLPLQLHYHYCDAKNWINEKSGLKYPRIATLCLAFKITVDLIEGQVRPMHIYDEIWRKFMLTKQNTCRDKAQIIVYSYFKKGRKKCTRQSQSRKVLWVVLSSLFFKEIWKNGTRGHGRMFARAKGKQQKKFWLLQCLEQCIDHIPYYFSGSSRAHFCRQPFSK